MYIHFEHVEHVEHNYSLSSPFLLNKNSFISTIWRVRQDKKIINSMRPGDEEEMGVYNMKHDVMISEIPAVFKKYIHSLPISMDQDSRQ